MSKIGSQKELERIMYVRGLTQRTLAEKAGISLQTVANTIRGVNLPRIEVSNAIAEVLGIEGETLRTILYDMRKAS